MQKIKITGTLSNLSETMIYCCNNNNNKRKRVRKPGLQGKILHISAGLAGRYTSTGSQLQTVWKQVVFLVLRHVPLKPWLHTSTFNGCIKEADIELRNTSAINTTKVCTTNTLWFLNRDVFQLLTHCSSLHGFITARYATHNEVPDPHRDPLTCRKLNYKTKRGIRGWTA